MVRVVSKESRRLILTTTSCISIIYEHRMRNVIFFRKLHEQLDGLFFVPYVGIYR
jgi:hypothetical protein